MRKSSRDYRKESRVEPFELDLDNPTEGHDFVTFKNPNQIETESAFDLSRSADAEMQLRLLLSEEDFAAFWAEWRRKPLEETNALIADVFDHYGANRGKLPR